MLTDPASTRTSGPSVDGSPTHSTFFTPFLKHAAIKGPLPWREHDKGKLQKGMLVTDKQHTLPQEACGRAEGVFTVLLYLY